MANNKPIVISSADFEGSDNLDQDQLDKLLISNTVNAAQSLVSGWNKEDLLIVPCLSLNNSNSAVTNGTITLQGIIPKKSVSAARFFENVDKTVQLTFGPFNASLFTFEGSLSSALLDSSMFDYSLKDKDGKDLGVPELEEFNFGGFSLRIYVNPIPPVGWAKVDISLFPLKKEELLLEHPLAADVRFPGISVAHPSGSHMLAPRSADLFPETRCGCPIAPALVAITSPSAAPFSISTAALKEALSVLMRTNIKPDNKRNIKFLLPRWAEVLAKGAAGLLGCSPDHIWPPSTSPPPASTAPPAGTVHPTDPLPTPAGNQGRTSRTKKGEGIRTSSPIIMLLLNVLNN